MIQRIPIALAQVKAGNTSDNLQNKIRQIIYALYWAKKLMKKYITMSWIQSSYKIEWILYLWILKRVKHFWIYYSRKNVKKSYQNNKFKISAPTWNEELELSDWSYSVSDIQDCFKYIFKKSMRQLLIILQ